MKKLTLSLAALMACTLSFAANYEQVTDASTLQAGDVIVIGCAEKGKVAAAIGTGKFLTAVDATFADGVVALTDAYEIKLSGDATAWTLTSDEGVIGSTAAKTMALGKGTTTWTIAIAEGKATITCGKFGRILYNAGSPRFLNYTSNTSATMLLPELYKKVAGADVPATAIALSETTLTKEQYKNVKLTATLTPAEATTEVVWSSDNEEVATVANGVVTMVGVGNATITAKAGELTATCDITVTAATILTCAQAAEKALAVSANNELVADGKYVVHGYVIKEAGKGIEADFTKYGNYSFWMADDKDAEQGTFEAFQVAPADGTTLVQVGDYVEVVGELTKYNTTAETAPKTGTVKVITAHETAIETVEVSDIYANNGRIENIGNGRIYTISGVDVTEMNGQLKGIYVVKMNDKAHKVVVK